MSCLGNKHESTVLAQALATAAAAARGEGTEEPSFFRLVSRLPIFDDDGEDISRSMWVEDFVILRSRYCNFKAHTRNSTLYVVLHRRAGKKKKHFCSSATAAARWRRCVRRQYGSQKCRLSLMPYHWLQVLKLAQPKR